MTDRTHEPTSWRHAATAPADQPTRALDAAAQQPGETAEAWFRRTFGDMPPPATDADTEAHAGAGAGAPAGSARHERRGAALAALAALERTIPGAYRWARFSAPELRQRVPAPAIAWAQGAWQHERLCLMGAARTGKTSLAVAMLRRWAADAGKPATFVHAHKLGVARLLHPAGHGEPEVVELAMRAPLVLVDDLGGERDHAMSAVPDVIVERHAENRPTWVTTGMTREQLVKRYGQGVVARVFERATVIHVGADASGRAGHREPANPR